MRLPESQLEKTCVVVYRGEDEQMFGGEGSQGKGRGRRAAACSIVNPQNYQRPKLKVRAAQRPDRLRDLRGLLQRVCVDPDVNFKTAIWGASWG